MSVERGTGPCGASPLGEGDDQLLDLVAGDAETHLARGLALVGRPRELLDDRAVLGDLAVEDRHRVARRLRLIGGRDRSAAVERPDRDVGERKPGVRREELHERPEVATLDGPVERLHVPVEERRRNLTHSRDGIGADVSRAVV